MKFVDAACVKGVEHFSEGGNPNPTSNRQQGTRGEEKANNGALAQARDVLRPPGLEFFDKVLPVHDIGDLEDAGAIAGKAGRV